MKQMQEVSVTLLGSCTICCDGRTLTEAEFTRENQSWSMLEYLLWNHGRRLSMEELKPIFGDTAETEKSESILRVRLHRSRAILEKIGLEHPKKGLVLSKDGCFFLNPDYLLTRDTDPVDQAYAAVLENGMTGTQLLECCLAALGQYDGSFLQNALPQPWILTERERYQRIFSALACTALDLIEETGTKAGTALLCEKSLLVCPGNLRLQKQLLTVLVRQGSFAEAANHYAGLAVRLSGTGTALPDFRELTA